MSHSKPFLVAVLSAAVLTLGCGISYAATGLQVGQRLSAAEQAALGPLARHGVAGSTVRAVPGVAARNADGASGATTVVDAQGVVGVSRNEVMISRMPTDEVRSLAPALTRARTVDYYEHMQMTSLRYASFAEAVAARDRLQAALPAAQVSLPIQYQKRRSR